MPERQFDSSENDGTRDVVRRRFDEQHDNEQPDDDRFDDEQGDDQTDEELDLLISRADVDELIRMIDNRCSSRQWEGLLRLRNRAQAALRTGRQLWPIATLAEYRLALWAPAQWAAQVMTEDSGRFAIGPLTEVIAQNHSWDELSRYLPDGPRRAVIAYERALRGEVIDISTISDDPFELPLQTEPWEPEYQHCTYSDDGFACDAPTTATPASASASAPDTTNEPGAVIYDADIERAARAIVEQWTSSSNGRFAFAGVEGDARCAVQALGIPPEQVRLAQLTPANAIAWLAWAGASGGAHGRRRGAAAGRFAAWWFVAAVGGLIDDWPPSEGEVGDIATELRWFWWDSTEPATGWQLQICLEDPIEGVSWAISAQDVAS